MFKMETDGQHLFETEDNDLIEIARDGDNEAFGELVRRYRSRAMTWAQVLARDYDLAEDIVQEALIKAFINIGKLHDVRAFSPWLRKIVQNQARMKLRRGGPYAKEEPITLIAGKENRFDGADLEDIDQVLARLKKSAEAQLSVNQTNPEYFLMKKETYHMIEKLINCLSKQEKDVFKAYFFQEISPMEISSMLQTSVDNVYNTLSRSRVKIKRERTKIYITSHVDFLVNAGGRKRNVLLPPIHL